MLLLILHRLSRRLYGCRHACLVFAVLGLAVGLYAAISDTDDLHSWTLRLSLVFSLWSLVLFACIQLFRQLPAPVLPELSWTERLRDRLRLLLYQGLAVLILLLSVFLLYLSFKLLSV